MRGIQYMTAGQYVASLPTHRGPLALGGLRLWD
jgi:hypothetical protein